MKEHTTKDMKACVCEEPNPICEGESSFSSETIVCYDRKCGGIIKT